MTEVTTRWHVRTRIHNRVRDKLAQQLRNLGTTVDVEKDCTTVDDRDESAAGSRQRQLDIVVTVKE